MKYRLELIYESEFDSRPNLKLIEKAFNKYPEKDEILKTFLTFIASCDFVEHMNARYWKELSRVKDIQFDKDKRKIIGYNEKKDPKLKKDAIQFSRIRLFTIGYEITLILKNLDFSNILTHPN